MRLPYDARDYGVWALVLLGGVVSFAALRAHLVIREGYVHFLGAASGLGAAGLLGSWIARRRRDAAAVAAERANEPASVVEPPEAPSLVALTLAIPSFARAELAEATAGATGHALLGKVTDFVARHDWPAKVVLTVAPPEASSTPAEALDALARHDRSAEGLGYRAEARSLSRAGGGWSVLGIALSVRAPGAVTAFGDRQMLRGAIEILLPVEPESVVSHEVRWLPEDPSHAFDEASLTTLAPDFGPI